MSSFVAGLRPTLRSLGKNRAFTIAAVLTLGLGMGATTAIYTLLHRIVLDPLPYPQAEQLVRLKNPMPVVAPGEEWELSTAQYFYYSQHARSLAAIGLFEQGGMNFTPVGDAAPQRVDAAYVTASTLPLIGARAERGRLLDARDDAPSAPPVVVLSYGFWERAFGSDTHVVGQTIHLDEQPYEVIGVMARGAALPPDRGQAAPMPVDVWMAVRLNPAGPFANNHVWPGIARLANGITLDGAQAEIDHLKGDLNRVFPTVYSPGFLKHFSTKLYPLKQYAVGSMTRYLWILFGAVGLVLIIACANVANLLLVRLETRRREFAIRSALGAGWRDLARDAFRESLTLALAGGVLAVVIAWFSTRWLAWLAPQGLPRIEDIHLDGHVMTFTALLALVIAGALAIAPALRTRSASGVSTLGEGGRAGTAGVERTRLRGTLVVFQVALALVLVVSSSLLLRSFARLRAVNPGVDAHNVLAVRLYLPRQRYDSLAKAWRFYDAALTKIRALPGVQAAGVSEELPFEGGYGCTAQGFEDQIVYDHLKDANVTTCAGQAYTSPGFFDALRIPLITGRTFAAADNDNPSQGAVIVSQAFAERFWPGQNAIGKGVAPNGNGKPFYHVVGVVGDVHRSSIDEPPAIAIYYPIVPIPAPGHWSPDANALNLVVRLAKGDPLSYMPAIRRAVAAVDPAIPIANAEDMEAVVARSMSRLSFTMTLLGIAGGVALLLAAIGLYGLISYVVTRRTNEIGVRLALGAQPSQVQGLVVRGALQLTAVGLVLGVFGATMFTRVLRTLLFGVGTWDPVGYAAAVCVLGTVAGFAGWLPARRAARVDPAVALRND